MEIIRVYASSDGLRKLEISRRSDGLFSFEEMIVELHIEPDAEFCREGETYWMTTELSGLHSTLEAAEAEAEATRPWMRSREYQPASPATKGL